MKFIHAADIHLDSPLSGLASYEGIPADVLRNATREAFVNLATEAIEERVDFMVIAGDLYDGTWRDYNTGFFFCREMARLHKAGIPVYLLFGNHDAESEMTKHLSLPPNVHAFKTRKPTTFRIDALRVALHGQSFKEAKTLENLAAGYPEPTAGWLNIGVLHTALEGNADHATYAPCSLAELSAKGYDYWALGHVHEHAIVQKEPWVVFPGNLQGRHIRETGPRGAVLVTAEGDKVVSVERLFVDVLRWHRLRIDASQAHGLSDVVNATADAFERLLSDDSDGKPAVARVVVEGSCPAHGELFGREAELRAEILVQALLASSEKLWVEKVQVDTTPAMSRGEIRARADAVADLQALLDDAPADEGLLRNITEELQQLTERAPAGLRELLPEFKAIHAGEVTSIVKSVSSSLIAQLAKGE